MNRSKHIRIRCQQRGIREADLSLIAHYGTTVRDGVVLTRKDIAETERNLKQVMSRLQKLEGVFVATKDETFTTVFRPTKHQLRCRLVNT